MTAQIRQAPVQVLGDEDGKARVRQAIVQVLWGVDSTAQVHQAHLQILARPPVRRTIGVTY